ncbi:MAG: phosphoribosylformylglycinamidine synthase subunit PurL [Alphaproteobacteria bacterium]
MSAAVQKTSSVDPIRATAREHGMTDGEYDLLCAMLAREPGIAELGIASVMWSEHCSYKSSKVWLKQLPTTAPWVICGPGENAGVIDIGDGQAAIFKMESHNHPSYIEPYQGAATGVGGILRDVFTMGARPIANLNALRFGAPDHPKTRQLLSGVVSGIGGYGNCVGIPTVGGELNFHPSYNGNCLVNAMTVGVAQADKIFYAKAAGIGNNVIYVGSKTGRDGIKGASMASAEFGADAESKRPTVQVGDPFIEKLLIEACLELMATDAIIAIQDMGAAGLTSSSVEMAARGGLGIDLDLDNVPQRETGMTAYDIMLSESQERMLIILKPGREAAAEKIFHKWELDFAVVGKLTDTGRLVVRQHGKIEADMPVAELVDKAPLYERPWEPTPPQPGVDGRDYPLPARMNPFTVLEKMLATADLCSRRWVYEQYDNTVGADTAQGSGGDAAVVRVHGTNKALAMTSDCTPRYCFADPVMGGKQAVAESWRNLTAVGALPLAITDNMNFGNPEKPRIMGQFAGAIQGMKEACLTLDYPVVSGNCSLYNETQGVAILPTPTIGGVGILQDVGKAMNTAFKNEGDSILLIGNLNGHIGQSIYLREIHGKEIGTPPPVDLSAEKKHGDFVRKLIDEGQVNACHDISDGGLLIALAEMAMAGNLGAALDFQPAHPTYWFSEDQACYVVTAAQPDPILQAAKKAGIPAKRIGIAGGGDLQMIDGSAVDVAALRKAHESWLPDYMGKKQ